MFTVHFTVVCDNVCFILRCECKLKEIPELCSVYEYQFSAKKVHPEIILCSLMLCPILCYNFHHTFTFFKLYRVIHKSLWNFRTRLRNNQERQGRKEHINR